MEFPSFTTLLEHTPKIGEEEASRMGKLLTSGEGEANKSPAGKLLMDMLKTFSGYVDQDAEAIGRPNIRNLPSWSMTDKAVKQQRQIIADQNATEMKHARRQARDINDDYVFGPNRAKLSQLLYNANKQRGIIHATNLADIASVFLREESPKPFALRDPITGKVVKDPVTGKPQLTDWRKSGGILATSPYKAPREVDFEMKAKNFLGYTYLGRVAIPHLFQNFNVALNDGISAWAKAWVDIIKDPQQARDTAIRMGALWEDTYRDMLNIADGKDTIWHRVFHMPAFNFVRGWELVHAANAGKYAAENAARELLQSASKASKLQLEMLGLNPTDILRRGSLSAEDILTAGFRSADENMFIERGLKTPWLWEETSGWRLMFLYKSFQFREGKLIKDAIVRSLKSGPLQSAKTLAILGIMFPIAGEAIAALENIATFRWPFDKGHPAVREAAEATGEKLGIENIPSGKGDIFHAKFWGKRNPYVDEVLDAYGHMAAFGIWYSLFRAVASNRATDWMTGPGASLFKDILTSSYYGGFKGKFDPAAKAILRRVPVVGPSLAAHEKELKGLAKEGYGDVMDFLFPNRE